jgi:hypothetical protein
MGRNQESMDLSHHTRQLITDDEKVVHIGKLHPFTGLRWLLVSLFNLGFALFMGWGTLWMKTSPSAVTISPSDPVPTLTLLLCFGGLAAATAFFAYYLLPFWRSFLIITDKRALIGVGHFTCVQEQVLPYQLEDWEIRQNFFESLLDYGHITLRLLEGHSIRTIFIPHVWHPHAFMREIEELCPAEHRAGARRVIASAPAAENISPPTSHDPDLPPGGEKKPENQSSSE